MEILDRIALCKQCRNRSFDPSQGIICGLTKAKPDFDTSCRDFVHDSDISERQDFQGNYTSKASRGGCLTTILVFIIIGASINIFSSLIIVVTQPPELLQVTPLYFYTISIFAGGLALAGAIMMFQWKKVGIYLYGGYLLINVAMQIQLPGFQTTNLIGLIIGLLIMFAVIAPKWDNFR